MIEQGLAATAAVEREIERLRAELKALRDAQSAPMPEELLRLHDAAVNAQCICKHLNRPGGWTATVSAGSHVEHCPFPPAQAAFTTALAATIERLQRAQAGAPSLPRDVVEAIEKINMRHQRVLATCEYEEIAALLKGQAEEIERLKRALTEAQETSAKAWQTSPHNPWVRRQETITALKARGLEPGVWDKYRAAPPPPWPFELGELIICDALTQEGVAAWSGDATSCVSQIVGAYSTALSATLERLKVVERDARALGQIDQLLATGEPAKTIAARPRYTLVELLAYQDKLAKIESDLADWRTMADAAQRAEGAALERLKVVERERDAGVSEAECQRRIAAAVAANCENVRLDALEDAAYLADRDGDDLTAYELAEAIRALGHTQSQEKTG